MMLYRIVLKSGRIIEGTVAGSTDPDVNPIAAASLQVTPENGLACIIVKQTDIEKIEQMNDLQ
jgi:hypothetical protein